MEELRECLKSMTLNSDYVSDVLACRIHESTRSVPELHALKHTMPVMSNQEVQNSMVYRPWEGGRECGVLGHHSHNLN